MNSWNQAVSPHSPIQELVSGLWLVQGSIKRNPLPRNMVIWKMPTGGLLIHSAICLQEDAMQELDALGPVEVIVIPSAMHRIDAARFSARYPNATFACPSAAMEAAQQVVPHPEPMEKILTPHGIIVHSPKGLKPAEQTLELPLQDGGKGLLFNDCLFNLQPNPPAGLGGWMLKILGSVKPLGITPLGKKLMLENASEFQNYLRTLAQIDNLRVLCVSHGQPILESVQDALAEAAERI